MRTTAHPPRPAGADGSLLAIDQGTTNTKALLVDAATGRVLARGSSSVRVAFPGPDSVEQDLDQIWDSVLAATAECLTKAGNSKPAGIAISSQRESVAVWDGGTGAALGPVLSWQDARTARECATLAPHRGIVRVRTGLQLDPMFSAPKMRWLLDHAAPSGDLRAGTIDTYLLDRLTGQYVAEAGNASRTLLMDLITCDWDSGLLEIFGIPVGLLAPVAASDADFGVTRPGLTVPAGTPVMSVLADSHAALYFHSGDAAHEGKVTYGTGSSVMVPTESTTAPEGVAATLAWLTDRATYAREGNIIASGAALAWVAGLIAQGDVGALADMAQEASHSPVTLVPAFAGLGAPYFDRDAVGVLTGLTGGTTSADIAWAAFEAVAHQVADVVEAIESDGGARLDVLHADGGASVSRLLMQMQADVLGRQVRVTGVAEASALGAALLAAEKLGFSRYSGWGESGEAVRQVAPAVTHSEREARRSVWGTAVRRSRGHVVKQKD